MPPRTDVGRCIAMGGVVAPAGYKEPTGDSPPASECSNVFEGQAEAEVERLNKTTSEKVALRHWTGDERINGYENEPSVWTRPTVEALLPYNRRRREGGATARARARARGGKEEKRPSRTALKQARAVKTGQVQLQRRAPRLPREHGGREGGVSGTVRHPSVRGWTRAPTSPLVAGLAWASAGCTPSCPAARWCSTDMLTLFMRHQTPQRLSACSRHCRRIGFATGQRASIASITLTSSRIILSEFYPWCEVFLSSPNVYNRLTQFARPGMAEQRDAVGSRAGATRASMRKGCGWAATPTMASRIGAPAAAGNTSQASSGYPRRHFLCLRDRIANVGRAQLRSSSVAPSEVSLAFQPAPRQQLRRRVDEQ